MSESHDADILYSDADLEYIEACQEANEIDAMVTASEGGKPIDDDAKAGLRWVCDNTFGGSLTCACVQWLTEAGYSVDDEAYDAIYRAIFRDML